MAKQQPDPHKELLDFVAKYRTQAEAAEALDISQAYLNDLIHAKRNCSDNILEKLGLERIETIVRAS